MPIFSLGERRVHLHGRHHFIAYDATLAGSVTLENDVNVWFKAVIRGDNDAIHIDEGSNIQDGAILHVDPDFPLTLGKRVSIGHKAMLHGCSVGDGSLIGINSVVMNGARIGAGSLIGANSLIAEGKCIPDGVLVVGSPGKIMRDLSQQEQSFLLELARGYVERSRLYKAELRTQAMPQSALL